MTARILPWYLQEGMEGSQTGYTVVEARMGNSRNRVSLPRWQRELFERLSVMVSVATAQTMAQFEQRLVVCMECDDRLQTTTVEGMWTPPKKGKWYVQSAHITFNVAESRARMALALLAKPEKPYGYTNAYRITACEQDESGLWWLTVELARGVWKPRLKKSIKQRLIDIMNGSFGTSEDQARLQLLREQTQVAEDFDQLVQTIADGGGWIQGVLEREGELSWRHTLSVIQSTTGLQQLINTYMQPEALMALPRAFRPGVCQEVAQQVTSYIGQLDSTKVRGEVAFPTIEDRNPARRREVYEKALEDLVYDLRPIQYAPVRELFPGKYALGDPRGDRLAPCDERWRLVARTPDPHPIPLFIVDGKSVRVQVGYAEFEQGSKKRDRHRGTATVSSGKQTSRSRRFYYARIPVLDTGDSEIQRILVERVERKLASKSQGRGIDFALQNVPLMKGVSNRSNDRDVHVPLSFDSRRMERLLHRTDLQVAWTRIVKKGDDWFLQLTLRVPYEKPRGIRKVLGVSFGLDAVLSWTLIDEHGELLESGAFAENRQIAEFIGRKTILEGDQSRGRWIGGRGFDQRLKNVAHEVVNDVIALAVHFGAVVSVQDVQYVQKSGPDSAMNVLFTAWNFGQLRRSLDYKLPFANLGTPVAVHDFKVRMTCPACGACRDKKDSKGAPTTWRTNVNNWQDTLHCAKCEYVGTPTGPEQALVVATESLSTWRKWWAKEEGTKSGS